MIKLTIVFYYLRKGQGSWCILQLLEIQLFKFSNKDQAKNKTFVQQFDTDMWIA